MFESNVSVKELIDELKNTEIDIALTIPDSTYVQWFNSLQQILYTEIIKEQKKYVDYIITLLPEGQQNGVYDLEDIQVGGNESKPRFEDIYAVYSNGTQLIKSTITSGTIFPNTYFKMNNQLGYRAKNTTELTIIYIVRPALVTPSNINDAKVMLPVEFIDLVKAKLRGEAYKLANEDNLAAKWLNDYNVLLETFKAWIADKSPKFGM